MYARISNFGNINTPVDDPITYSLTQTMDKDFVHPPIGYTYGPANQNSQLYMAERCAKNWDGYCTYYAINNPTKSFPNTVSPWLGQEQVANGLTMGETLVGNAAERRFCDFSTCKKVCEPFDPTVANSPMVCYYDTDEGTNPCIPVCSVDPKTIDDDVVMNMCLQKPERCFSTMANICNNAQRNGVNLDGTKLGGWCKAYLASKDSRS